MNLNQRGDNEFEVLHIFDKGLITTTYLVLFLIGRFFLAIILIEVAIISMAYCIHC